MIINNDDIMIYNNVFNYLKNISTVDPKIGEMLNKYNISRWYFRAHMRTPTE